MTIEKLNYKSFSDKFYCKKKRIIHLLAVIFYFFSIHPCFTEEYFPSDDENIINEDDFLATKRAPFNGDLRKLENDPDLFNFDELKISPNKAWDSMPPKSSDKSDLEVILLWLPNRLLDFIDIFRIDLGIGPSAGATFKFTKYIQVGKRTMYPGSVRTGLFGRKMPFHYEYEDEFGISPYFKNSKLRKPCPGEISVGIDLFLAGIYTGVCFDELADFIIGFSGVDISGDDY